MDPVTNRNIYDSDKEDWEDNRKSILHDHLKLRKKLNKDVLDYSKSKVAKIPPKKRKISATIIVKPKLLRVLPFYSSLKLF